jgi:hypothetical protein
MLGVACHEHPTCVVHRKLGVANGGHTLTPHRVALVSNGEQGDGGVTEDRQVALTELREGLEGSPLQSVIEVVTLRRGEPSHHHRVSGVRRNVHMDLAGPKPEPTVRVAKVVQHVPEEGEKTEAVQPVPTEPPISSDGGVVVIHLSKTREK